MQSFGGDFMAERLWSNRQVSDIQMDWDHAGIGAKIVKVVETDVLIGQFDVTFNYFGREYTISFGRSSYHDFKYADTKRIVHNHMREERVREEAEAWQRQNP
jgi:hypothetical protein